MFSGKDVPAVGISIGIERVFKILQVRLLTVASASCGALGVHIDELACGATYRRCQQ